jgi:hypothetical protein
MDTPENDVMAALSGDKPVLVFVYSSTWPNMPDVWDLFESGYGGAVTLMSVDIRTARKLGLAYGVKYLPTFLSNRQGAVIGTKTLPGLNKLIVGIE